MAKKEKKDAGRQARWEQQLAEQKANNPSVYDTQGGDAQINVIPASFL